MIAVPGGYLSPKISQYPTVTTDIVSDTVYWTPKVNALPVHDGTEIVTTSPGQLALHLTAAHAKDAGYTVAAFLHPGTGLPAIGTTPWTNSGFGTSAVAPFFIDANLPSPPSVPTWLPVNHADMDFRNGDDVVTIPAGQAIQLGAIRPRDAGLVGCDCSAGTDRRWDVVNLWNQETIELRVTDIVIAPPEDNWTYSSIHPEYAAFNPLNRATVLSVRPTMAEAEYLQCAFSNNANNIITAIMYNNEVWDSGQWPNQPSPGQTKPGAYKRRGFVGTSGGGIVVDLAGQTIGYGQTVTTSHAQATVYDCSGVNKFTGLQWIESYRPSTPSAGTMYLSSREYSMVLRVRFKG